MLVLCPYPQGVAAGQRLKYEQYFDDWRAAGWEIEVSSYMDRPMWDVVWQKGHLLDKAVGVLRGHARRLHDMLCVHRFDLVYVFMWVTPFGTTLMERFVRAQAKALIYDVEDNFLSLQKPQVPRLRGLARSIFNRTRKMRFLVSRADDVIVASPYLVGSFEGIAAGSVHLIPPSIDTQRIVPTDELPPNDRLPVIGWTGTFSSRTYLDMIAPALQELARRIPYTLRIIGNFDYVLPGVELDVVRWSAESEAKDLQSLDIGVYPLADDDWSRGKAGLKIIQYQAAGLPCVASDVPLSREQLRDGETGYLVSSQEHWVERLEQLLRDPNLRRKMGRAGRKDAVVKYSQKVISQQYRKILLRLFQ